MENISVQEAKKLDEIEKKLIKEFKQQIKFEENYEKVKQKAYEPITSAINKVENKIGEVLNENKNLMELVPVVHQFANIEIPEENEEEELFKLPSSTPFKPIRQKVIEEIDNLPQIPVEQESTFIDPNIVSPNTLNKIIGPIAQKYLPRAKDNKFGLYWNKHKKSFMIGDKITVIDNDDLIVNNKKYNGTLGLWRLITYPDKPDNNLYDQNDLNTYSKILWETNSIFKNNDPNTKKPKSSKGDKYMNLIKPIWESKEGSGIRKYTENKIEYRFIDDLNKLDGIINYIYAQEKAGNNNFINEKRAIKDFISNKLDELIEKPEGIKYLKRILPTITSPLLKDGSGILNDVINNLPFELHVPGYQYLGPGTKLQKRIKRGDPGINDLDKAAKEHDIFYRDHKDTESRNNIADKILQEKAWEIAKSNDHDISERLIAIPTVGAMWLKRKLGMGLEIGLKF